MSKDAKIETDVCPTCGCFWKTEFKDSSIITRQCFSGHCFTELRQQADMDSTADKGSRMPTPTSLLESTDYRQELPATTSASTASFSSFSTLVEFVVMNTKGVLVQEIEVRPSRLIPALRKLPPWVCVIVNGSIELHFPGEPL